MADLLERRYAVSILYASHQGCTRFTEFRQALGEIPPGTLAQRLVELEQAGVLRREVTRRAAAARRVRADAEGGAAGVDRRARGLGTRVGRSASAGVAAGHARPGAGSPVREACLAPPTPQ